MYGHNKNTKGQKGWKVKESKLLPDTNSNSRVDLYVADFDKLIEQKGVNFRVYRTVYCPNVKSVDGAEHEIDCQLCNGSGYLDRNPLCVKGFIQNQDLEKIFGQSGQHDGNSVLITFPTGIELQYFTLVELVDFTDIYFQRVMRKPGSDTDVLKYRACRVNMIVDQSGNEYYQDQDFTIDQNGNIKWKGTIDNSDPQNPVFNDERAPRSTNIYSIHYEMHVQFRATRAMHVNRFTQYKSTSKVEHIKMMEQWVCTKEFLLRRRDINTNQDLEQGPFDQHINTTDRNGFGPDNDPDPDEN
jgi:hypothetical protein